MYEYAFLCALDNQETFTKDTRRRQAKHKNKAQHRKLKI
jgi:hypothetical protein